MCWYAVLVDSRTFADRTFDETILGNDMMFEWGECLLQFQFYWFHFANSFFFLVDVNFFRFFKFFITKRMFSSKPQLLFSKMHLNVWCVCMLVGPDKISHFKRWVYELDDECMTDITWQNSLFRMKLIEMKNRKSPFHVVNVICGIFLLTVNCSHHAFYSV